MPSLSCVGVPDDPPLEVVALSARNVFEIYLRLKYVLMSDADCQNWRNEAVTDQLQIYEGVLEIQGSESGNDKIRQEIERIRQLADLIAWASCYQVRCKLGKPPRHLTLEEAVEWLLDRQRELAPQGFVLVPLDWDHPRREMQLRRAAEGLEPPPEAEEDVA